MPYIYSDPKREHDPHALPDTEVFELTAAEAAELDEEVIYEYSRKHEYRLAHMNSRIHEKMIEAIIEEQGITGGWFYRACSPGCLPDGSPFGPYATQAEAIAAAQEDSNG